MQAAKFPIVEHCHYLSLFDTLLVSPESIITKYERYKSKYSNRMEIEIICARARARENGPPLSSFPASKARHYWVENNHRLAQKVRRDISSLTLV